MAFEGSPPWNRTVQAPANDDLAMECPGCDEYLTIAITEPPATTIAMDDDLLATAIAPPTHSHCAAPPHGYAIALQQEGDNDRGASDQDQRA